MEERDRGLGRVPGLERAEQVLVEQVVGPIGPEYDKRQAVGPPWADDAPPDGIAREAALLGGGGRREADREPGERRRGVDVDGGGAGGQTLSSTFNPATLGSQ